MPGSPLKKFILTPVLISASIFAVLSLPLVLIGNQQITIKMQEETAYDGKLRDVATPYLGFAGIFALGAGVVCVALSGWQQSSRKSEAVEAQLSGLAQHLKEKEAQLEALKLSESRLEVSGLKAFLEEDIPLESTNMTSVPIAHSPLVMEEYVTPLHTIDVQAIPSPQRIVQSTTAKFACAQTFLGYTYGKTTPKPVAQVISQTYNKDVEQLQTQLQHLMAQMASLQAALSTTDQVGTLESHLSGNVPSLQVVKPWSVHQKIS